MALAASASGHKINASLSAAIALEEESVRPPASAVKNVAITILASGDSSIFLIRDVGGAGLAGTEVISCFSLSLFSNIWAGLNTMDTHKAGALAHCLTSISCGFVSFVLPHLHRLNVTLNSVEYALKSKIETLVERPWATATRWQRRRL